MAGGVPTLTRGRVPRATILTEAPARVGDEPTRVISRNTNALAERGIDAPRNAVTFDSHVAVGSLALVNACLLAFTGFATLHDVSVKATGRRAFGRIVEAIQPAGSLA